MAGSDAGGMQWARAYDTAVVQVEAASVSVVEALGQMSVLLHATGGNHAAADTASVPGGGNACYPPPPTANTSFGVCAPPSAAGGSASLPPGWHWVADLMEYTWPNGDQDRAEAADPPGVTSGAGRAGSGNGSDPFGPGTVDPVPEPLPVEPVAPAPIEIPPIDPVLVP